MQRKKIEKDGAVFVCLNGEQVAPSSRVYLFVDGTQTRRLSGQTGPVVDELQGQFTSERIDPGQRASAFKLSALIPPVKVGLPVWRASDGCARSVGASGCSAGGAERSVQ